MIGRNLSAFLASWLVWAENGAPDYEPYNRSVGLCSNSRRHSHAAGRELEDELEDDFPDDTSTPFNDDDNPYWDETASRGHHLNPRRLAWVRRKLAEEL